MEQTRKAKAAAGLSNVIQLGCADSDDPEATLKDKNGESVEVARGWPEVSLSEVFLSSSTGKVDTYNSRCCATIPSVTAPDRRS